MGGDVENKLMDDSSFTLPPSLCSLLFSKPSWKEIPEREWDMEEPSQ